MSRYDGGTIEYGEPGITTSVITTAAWIASAVPYDGWGYSKEHGWYTKDEDDPATATEEVLLEEIKRLRTENQTLRSLNGHLNRRSEYAMTPERIAELRRFGEQEYKADPIESSWTAMLDEIERLQALLGPKKKPTTAEDWEDWYRR